MSDGRAVINLLDDPDDGSHASLQALPSVPRRPVHRSPLHAQPPPPPPHARAHAVAPPHYATRSPSPVHKRERGAPLERIPLRGGATRGDHRGPANPNSSSVHLPPTQSTLGTFQHLYPMGEPRNEHMKPAVRHHTPQRGADSLASTPRKTYLPGSRIRQRQHPPRSANASGDERHLEARSPAPAPRPSLSEPNATFNGQIHPPLRPSGASDRTDAAPRVFTAPSPRAASTPGQRTSVCAFPGNGEEYSRSARVHALVSSARGNVDREREEREHELVEREPERERDRDGDIDKYADVAAVNLSKRDPPVPRRASTRVRTPSPRPKSDPDPATTLRNINSVRPSTPRDDVASPQAAAEIASLELLKGVKTAQTCAQEKRRASAGFERGGKRAGSGASNGTGSGNTSKRRRTEGDADLKSSGPDLFETPLAGTRPRTRTFSTRDLAEHSSWHPAKVTRSSPGPAEVVVLDEGGRPASDKEDGSGNDSDGAVPVDEKEAAKKKRVWNSYGKRHLTVEFDLEKVAKYFADSKALIAMERMVTLCFCGLSSSSFARVIPLLADFGEVLEDLQLEHNLLEDFPAEFGELAKSAPLRRLTAEVNSLPRVPRALLQFKKLERINLSRNKITEVPPELFQLPELQSLTLSFNRISKLPTGLGSLKRLHLLHLESNELKALPDDLGMDNPALRIIDVYRNHEFGCGVPAAMLSLAGQLDHFFFEETELHNLLPRKIRDGSCQTVVEAVAGKSQEFVVTELWTSMGRPARPRRKLDSGGGKAEGRVQADHSVVDSVEENGDVNADEKKEDLGSGAASPEKIDFVATSADDEQVVVEQSTGLSAAVVVPRLPGANSGEYEDDEAERHPRVNDARTDSQEEVDRSAAVAEKASVMGDDLQVVDPE